MTLADVAVVDAPVIMQLKFQQSFVVSLEVPQIPFIDRVVDIPVGIDLQKTVEIPQLQFLDLVVVPVCATTSLVQTVQKTVELPQVQLLWCVDVPCDHAACSSSPVVRFPCDSVRQSAGHSSYAHSAVLEQGC